MARLRERQTGAIVNVPDEKVAQVLALGYYVREDEPTKAPAKRASSKTEK